MLIGLVFGLFGLIVGSFLNVVILRHGVRGIGGRSSCMQCGTTLQPVDLVPVFSWVVLRGRCRHCRGVISIQYPLVEASTGILFGFIGAADLPLVQSVIGLVIVALLVCITTYDLKHTIIPDEWAYAFAALAFLFSSLQTGFNGTTIIAIALSGLCAALPFASLWAYSSGTWMGLGDAKLALGIGFLLGPWNTYIALTSAFVLGAAVFIPVVIISRIFTPKNASAKFLRRVTMKSEVPFGPFLVFACIVTWILSLNGIDIGNLLFGGLL